MQELANEILGRVLRYWDTRLVKTGEGLRLAYQGLNGFEGKRFSSRMTSDVMMGYLVYGYENRRPDYTEKAVALMDAVLEGQHPCGAFEWNLGDVSGDNVKDQVDLGTVLDSYYYFLKLGVADRTQKDKILRSTARAVEYLSGANVPGCAGVIKKRDRGEFFEHNIDTLNGEALAVTAFVRGGQILGNSALIDSATPYVNTLLERLGGHYKDWWVYTEDLPDRSITLDAVAGISIFFQAMTLLYLEPYYRQRPSERLRGAMTMAMRAIDRYVGEDGSIDYWYERRADFIKTQNAMLPACFFALKDVHDMTGKAQARLRLINDRMVDKDGVVFNEDGREADDMRKIWLVSDLALCLLYGKEGTTV